MDDKSKKKPSFSGENIDIENQILKIGDTIGVIAPSSSIFGKDIDNNIKMFEQAGYKIKLSKNALGKYGYLSAPDKERTSDIHEMFQDKEVKVIMILRGGYGCLRILPLIDKELIRKNKKPILGFSDACVLLNYLSQECSTTSYHSPMLNYNFLESIETFNNIIGVLSKESKVIYLNKNGKAKSNSKKIIKGEIVGGNLATICSMIGTKYDIKYNNKILLIEDVNEKSYVIDRYLTQLYLSGKLDKLQGILIGQFTECIENGFNIEEVINSKFQKFKLPIIKNIEVGHCKTDIIIPIGEEVKVDFKEMKIDID